MIGPRSYKIEDAAKVVRVITDLLLNDEKLLEEDGILRISGNQSKALEINEKVLKGEKISSNVSAFDCTSAIKQVLSKENVYLTPKKNSLAAKAFQKALDKIDIEMFNSFVVGLVKSKDHTEQLAGEIIYRYLHFGKMVADKGSVNRMPPKNVAIVMATLFTNSMQCVEGLEDLSKLKDINEKVIKLMDAVLTSKSFSPSFEEAEYKRRSAERGELEKGKKELKEMQSAYREIAKSVKDKLKPLEREKEILEKSLEAKENIYKQGSMTKEEFTRDKKNIEDKIKSLEENITLFKESKESPTAIVKKYKEDLAERDRKLNPVTPTSSKRNPPLLIGGIRKTQSAPELGETQSSEENKHKNKKK